MGAVGRIATRATLAALLVSGSGPAVWAATAIGPGPEAFHALPPETSYHGSLDGFAFGGDGELRFAEDVEAGVSNPEWFSFGRANAFFFARPYPRVGLAGRAGWDRGADDFVLERAEMYVQVRRSALAHAGIFLAPLGRTNMDHDAPGYDFAERSLVATQLIGVPNAQFGAGVRSYRPAGSSSRFSYEVDLVTGYNDGLITNSPGGTRVPRGRSNYGDNNGMPALAWRIARRSSSEGEIGIAAQSGQYNRTDVGGVRVDGARWVHVVVADGIGKVAGFRASSEAAVALIDVPPGLEALFAERQWGASVEMVRTLLDPVLRSWRGSCLTAGIRADAVDFDARILGDSRSRLSASLNIHSRPLAVTRFGWYYEIRRDRFNNQTALAGLTLTAATYF